MTTISKDAKLWFRDICIKNCFIVSDAQLDLLERYVELLLSWNRKINLISRQEEEMIWERQILPSIAFLFNAKLGARSVLLDLGTGGGLPGIPLAIVCPDCTVTLLDSIQKKINAVQDILSHLPLPTVSTLCGRAEEVVRTANLAGTFDYVVSRAVAPVQDLIKWGKPFLKVPAVGIPADVSIFPRGSILMLKGGDIDNELRGASMKYPDVKIDTFPLVVRGMEGEQFPDKKLIIVRP